MKAEALDRVLRFELSPESYATAQEALTKIRHEAGGQLDDAQALLLMARQVLGGPKDDGRSSYQIAVSVCPRCERGFQQAHGELVELGPAAVEMACCDAQHIGDVSRNAGGGAHVGTWTGVAAKPESGWSSASDTGTETRTGQTRATQDIPPRIRRLVVRRAGHCCEVPRCTNSVFLDVHHRTLRSEGGDHDPNELT